MYFREASKIAEFFGVPASRVLVALAEPEPFVNYRIPEWEAWLIDGDGAKLLRLGHSRYGVHAVIEDAKHNSRRDWYREQVAELCAAGKLVTV